MRLHLKWLFAGLLLPLAVSAQNALPEPTPVTPPLQAFELPTQFTLVNDHAGMLPPSVEIRLARKLDALVQKNSTRIVLITVPSTGSEGVTSYSSRAFMNSGLGEGRGNGVLFLIDGSSGQFAIRTGAGIAGAMPDSWVADLIKRTIEPRWNREHYLEAVEAGLDAMIARAGGEETRAGEWKALEFVDHWKIVSWSSIGGLVLLYFGGCVVSRLSKSRRWPGIKVHAAVLSLACLIAGAIALHATPLERLLKSRQNAQGAGDFQTLKLERHPRSLAAMAAPGHITVIAITYEALAKQSSLETQLRDLTSLRPDVAVRIGLLDFDGWTTGELRHLYGQDMGILPYFMLFDAEGHLIAADEDAKQKGADLLDRWHAKEAYLAAGIKS